MISPEINLLVRMLRYQGKITEEKLEELLKRSGRRLASGEAFLAQIREEGLIDETWARDAAHLLLTKGRGQPYDSTERFQHDRRFGQLALNRSWITPDQLEEAILEQERLRRLRLRFRLGEILVRAGVLRIDQVRQILADQGLVVCTCISCQAVVNRPAGKEEQESSCPLCGGALCPAVFLEPVQGDGSA